VFVLREVLFVRSCVFVGFVLCVVPFCVRSVRVFRVSCEESRPLTPRQRAVGKGEGRRCHPPPKTNPEKPAVNAAVYTPLADAHEITTFGRALPHAFVPARPCCCVRVRRF
jgi:hypothetical protein